MTFIKKITNKKKPLNSLLNDFYNKSIPIIKMKQIHSNILKEAPKNSPHKICTIPNCDGLFTRVPNVALCVKFADCMPILIYHPKSLICVLHSGRKGTDLNFLFNTLEYFKTLLNYKEKLMGSISEGD